MSLILSNEILFSGIIGAIVGSILTVFLSAIIKYIYDQYQFNKDKQNLRLRLARAFWAEIIALLDIYEKVKLQPWTNINDSINLQMVNIQYDYLAIFNSNADKIGIFNSDDAAEFLKFYIFAKAYIDTLRELGRRWNNHAIRYENYQLNPQDLNIRNNYFDSLKDLFGIYNIAFDQQKEFYNRIEIVKKTFEKYL